MEFLDTSKKIKRIRKKLKMKQRELQDINITRAMISMIEIGKRKPSKENMISILDKFQKKAKELNIPFNLDLSYFLRNEKEDAQVYCFDILNGIVSIDEIVEIIEIANKYKLPNVLADAYLKLADKRFENLDYINSQVDYINAIENYKIIDVNDRIPYIYNMLGRCCINQTLNIQALNYFNIAYNYSVMYYDEDIKKKAIYNMALCNKKLGRIEEVLKYINIYIYQCDKEKDFLVYSYANILMANCYDSQGDFNKAIQVLIDLLEEVSDTTHPVLGSIYNNLGAIYCKQGEFEKSLQCLNLSQEIRTKKDIKNLSHTLLEKAILYTRQNHYKESISLLKSEIELSIKYNDFEYILKGYYKLIEIYKILKLDRDIEDGYMELLNFLTSSDLENHKEEIVRISVELLSIYLFQNKIQQSINILDVLRKLENK